eukprot:1153952-Amphidinium_carterae.1
MTASHVGKGAQTPTLMLRTVRVAPRPSTPNTGARFSPPPGYLLEKCLFSRDLLTSRTHSSCKDGTSILPKGSVLSAWLNLGEESDYGEYDYLSWSCFLLSTSPMLAAAWRTRSIENFKIACFLCNRGSLDRTPLVPYMFPLCQPEGPQTGCKASIKGFGGKTLTACSPHPFSAFKAAHCACGG